jgi:signal transduction histidine kinase
MRPLLPRNWTIRVRLTVLYGGMFFLAGAVLLGVTYLLVKQSLETRGVGFPDRGTAAQLGRLPELFGAPVDTSSIEKIANEFRRQQEAFRQQTLDSLLTQGAVALVLVGVAAVGFGWLMADRVLRPLHRITDTAARIAAAGTADRGLAERIAMIGPRDEIKTLADTFDSMLERLDRSFDGQRRFVANASHELRTPLAINRALIELAVTRPDASTDTRQLGESLLSINARHERLIDGLLMLADSENAMTERTAVDLADVAAHVAETAVAEAAEAGVTITTTLVAAPTGGDPVLLERLTQNLVENAIRHNVTGGRCELRTGRTPDGWAELVVTNTGPVVPRYELETIFQPFRRLSGERASPGRGLGLGLSIVAAVARAHGGQVSASPRDGGGLVVRVSLPGAGPATTAPVSHP